MNPRILVMTLGALFTGLLVLVALFFLTPDAAPPGPSPAPSGSTLPKTTKTPLATSASEASAETAAASELPPGALPNERVLRSRSPQQLNQLATRATQLGARILGSIPELGALRIGYDSPEIGQKLEAELGEEMTPEWNFVVTIPTPPERLVNHGGPYTGFGDNALKWLGVPEENSSWGAGSTVAVLDTKVVNVPGATWQAGQQIELIDSTTGPVPQHATSVSDIISKMAPAAKLLNIQVMDNSGEGSTFVVAEGVMKAIAGGAKVVTMSLGGYQDSPVLRDAIQAAQSRNIAVVAAVGNEGLGQVSYPAAYPGVIAVTAVDAKGRRGLFANRGKQVTLAAPGIGIFTPGVKGEQFAFSGTSAAAPFVAGMMAQLLSEKPSSTPQQAVEIMQANANDKGAPGLDPEYGYGIFNATRILERERPGITDAAVTDLYLDSEKISPSGIPLVVTVQNQGTTQLSNTQLSVNAGGRTQQFSLPGMSPGQVQSGTLWIDPNQLKRADGVLIESEVQLKGTGQDLRPENDKNSGRINYSP